MQDTTIQHDAIKPFGDEKTVKFRSLPKHIQKELSRDETPRYTCKFLTVQTATGTEEIPNPGYGGREYGRTYVVARSAGLILTKISSDTVQCTLIPGAAWAATKGGFFTTVPVFGVISRKAKLLSERGDVQKSGVTVQVDTLQRNPGITVIVIDDEVYKADEFSFEPKTLIHINGWSVKL